jgi:translocation and assembly module TamB
MSDTPPKPPPPETPEPTVETPAEPARVAAPRRRPDGRRVALWGLVVLAGLLLLAAVLGLGADTAGGRRLLADAVGGHRLANGLQVRVGRIEGSLYGRMTLRDVALSDAKGVFATAPALVVDWRPQALLGKHILLRELSADTVRLLRAPALKPTPPKPNQPLLPDIYLTVQRLHVGALVLEPALTGDRRSVRLDGSVELLHGRGRIDAQALAQMIDGHAGGDQLRLRLDAAPDQNRLAIDAHLSAPQGGVVDRLARLNAPLAFDLAGRGDWRAWNGRAVATLGGQSLLDTGLTARDGLFTIQGQARPALVLKGPPAALTQPALAIDLSGRLKDRQLAGRARLGSAAMTLAADGRLDLARNRFVGVSLAGRLLRPEAASPQLRGQDIVATLKLDGPFARPVVDYDVRAARLGFGATVLEQVHAAGKARVDADRSLRLPLHVTAARMVGGPEAIGGLARNLRIDGDLRVSAEQIASDNLRLRSDTVDATVVLALSLKTGRYDAALKGRVNRYAVKGLGVVDLVTDARLVPTGRGVFRIAGHVQARTRSLTNAQVAKYLGGPAVLDADFTRSPEGVFGLANLHMQAPRFRILNGGGTYAANGRLALTANAVSADYGPLRLDVVGTVQAPQARLRAPSPKIAGLTGLDLRLTGTGAGAYAIRATAGSPYGPVDADLRVTLGAGALAADVRRLSVGGITASGQLRQTPAGPFAGLLRVSGSGLNGTARLSPEGRVQRADIALRAANARVPLNPPLTIARGTLTATAILYPKAPAVTGRAALEGLRQGGLLVKAATANIDYRGGSGRIDVSASGETSVPFTIALNAGLSPNLIRINGQGSVRRLPIRLAAPAEIRRDAGGYRLAPATLLLPRGQIELSGAFGKTRSLSARLRNVDLGLANVVSTSLGLSGQASGVIDLALPAGGGAPSGRAQLQVASFSRTGLTTVSEPVDIALLASLSDARAEASAVVRRRGAVIGRLQGRVTPGRGGPGGSWMQRFKAAPVSGGLRYNGPAEVLWAVTGIGGQEVSGPIAIGADVSGRLDRPRLNGVIRSKGVRYENTTFGTVIDNIAIDGRFTGTRLEIANLTARAGRGTLQARGYADLSSASGFPIDLRVTLGDATLARSRTVSGTVSGDLAVTNSRAAGALISGNLRVDQAEYQIARQGAADVVELTGVRRKGQPLQPASATTPATSGPPSLWKLDIGVRAANQLFVRGMGLDAEWRSDLRIRGDARNPVIVGDIDLVRGRFAFAGRNLTLSRGVIHLNGASPPNPTLDIQASTTVENVTATISIGGSARSPEITFGSIPALPQDEVLSRLLFGSSVSSLSPLQAVQLAGALNSLRGGGGLNPLGKLRRAAGLEELRFYGADTASGRGPSIGAGRYIGNNIYVEITTDARGFTATQIEIALGRSLRLLSQVGALGGSNLTLRYSKDY